MADEKLHETDEDQKDWHADNDGATQTAEPDNTETKAEATEEAQPKNADTADAENTENTDTTEADDTAKTVDESDNGETEDTKDTESEDAENADDTDADDAKSDGSENDGKKKEGFFKRRKNKKNKKKDSDDASDEDTEDEEDYGIPMDKVEAVLNATADGDDVTPQMRRMMQRQTENTKRVEESIKGTKSNPRWFVPLFCILMIIGLVWAVIYYLTSDYPIPNIGAWNLLIAFAIIMVGFIMTMWWR